MKLNILIVFLIVLFYGCSFKAPENQWEYNSSSAFSSYTKSFLSADIDLAKDDLNRAIKYAKQSANLNQLGRIYLGSCALNISVGEDDKCLQFKQIEELISSKELNAYYLMLQNKIKKEQIELLPKQYQTFEKYNLEKNYELLFESIKSIKQVSSQFIAASLVKKQLKKEDIKYLIDKASFYGYKSLVLYWLNYLYKIENDINQKQLLLKKIQILKQ
ncbi:MAG: hypothetical protein ACNI25_10365 [Halarcobacter sp.]